MTSTAETLDAHPEAGVCLVQFRSFGARAFAGPIATLRAFEDNVDLRERLSEPGDGQVLVVDGGGSMGCAVLGDNLAGLGLENGWAGIVLNACVRDADALDAVGLGVKALGTNPRPSRKRGGGERDVPVTFGGVSFEPGRQLHADADGVVVLPLP